VGCRHLVMTKLIRATISVYLDGRVASGGWLTSPRTVPRVCFETRPSLLAN